MNAQEFAAWTAETNRSAGRWIMDPIAWMNNRVLFVYKGGENGRWLEFTPDGHVKGGTYEGAVPHIKEAMFRVQFEQDFSEGTEAAVMAFVAEGVALYELASAAGLEL